MYKMGFSTNDTHKQEGEGEGGVAQSCPTLCNPVDCSLPGSSVRGTFPGILEWVLQGIFLTQGSNPGLSDCRQTLNRLSHQSTL